jgi:predicted metalloprotease with PDZ domain
VTAIASKIIRDYGQKVGYELRGRVVLMLSPFPGTVGVERWSAETRGSSVVLLLGRNSPPQVLLGRLSVVLTHELFHLFVPNALTLDGDYDWFFEGFTLYQALRTAVRLGFIDFQEYLATMARVYDSYRATPERDALSLIEATRRRWTATSSLVYDKGMLVAFLYDLRLRYVSKNRQSLDDVYRELFREYSLGARRVDGNEAIITLLNRLDGDGQISKRYLVNPEAINLETELPAHGFTVETSGNHSCFGVSRTVNNEQREMLAALGYRKPRK